MRLTTWRAISGRPCFAHRLPRKQRRDGSDGFRVPDGFAELLARQPQEPPRLHRERVQLCHEHAVDIGRERIRQLYAGGKAMGGGMFIKRWYRGLMIGVNR